MSNIEINRNDAHLNFAMGATLHRYATVLHVQVRFKAATYSRASSLIHAVPFRWWIAIWQISQILANESLSLKLQLFHTSSVPNRMNDEANVNAKLKRVFYYGNTAVSPRPAINILINHICSSVRR